MKVNEKLIAKHFAEKLSFCLALPLTNHRGTSADQGGAMRQFFSRTDTFSLIYMTSKGRGRYRKPPLRMRVSMYVGHTGVSSCCILGFTWVHTGFTKGYSLHTVCEPNVNPSVNPSESEYATKSDCFLA